ncbi:MAG: hypothetical protein M1816_006417 [Peltula sp. TS41687]|nr:MAG: hypothetical protein M1816_006417 [Peltula sp. TS41687]
MASSSTSTTSAASTPTDLTSILDSAAQRAKASAGISLSTFFASLSVSAIVFLVQFGFFLALHDRLLKIYQPRTYIVSQSRRVEPPPPGLIGWLYPVFTTPSSEFIERCGLDSFFFLRYLRTLLKIFIPLALVIIPILLPINASHGRGPHFAVGNYAEYTNVTGLDVFSFGNVRPENSNRYWAHLILAVFVVLYVGYVFYEELRFYLSTRQAYLTAPDHRLRASSNTVLVAGIPKDWLTREALVELYDVFPGGIRNVWINRQYDALATKILFRAKVIDRLETAEMTLIQKARKAHLQRLEMQAKKEGRRWSKSDKLQQRKNEDAEASRIAQTDGTSAGDPQNVEHVLHEASRDVLTARELNKKKRWMPIPMVEQGWQSLGQNIGRLGQTVSQGLKKREDGMVERSRMAGGLALDTGEVYSDGPTSNQVADPSSSDQHLQPRSVNAAINENSRSHGTRNLHGEAIDRTLARSDTMIQAFSSEHGNNGHEQNDMSDETHPHLHGDLTSERSMATDGTHEPPPRLRWAPWHQKRRGSRGRPSAQPMAEDDDEDGTPLSHQSPVTPGANLPATVNDDAEPKSEEPLFKTKNNGRVKYLKAFNEELEGDDCGEPLWKEYLSECDRDTMRVPYFGATWMPLLPFIGKKVDLIHYCRELVARLNVEIEQDQMHPEQYPVMNSAFIQFNNQIAAHMACQTLSHHIPKQMAPRLVEVSPDDVIWDNMSIRWFERWIRTAVMFTIVSALVVAWAIPVTVTGSISQIKSLTTLLPWLNWINKLPKWALSIVQGVLPPTILAALLFLLPMILRVLVKQQGVLTGSAMELSVQNYFFAFLFIQVFLVVSISSGLTSALRDLINDVASAPALLAVNLPRASNYFFSYMILQALSVSAGALLQVGTLLGWFILGRWDRTPRQKWEREAGLPMIQWGSFFPVYTNLAAIGLVYSVISPLILIFNIITFGLFWVIYRYNSLYVHKYADDTGGQLYPRAINQLFVGLYVMELCMVGLFFLVRDANGTVACKIQGILMIVVTILTLVYQILLNQAFGPLIKYVPISLEDAAVLADTKFQEDMGKRRYNSQAERWGAQVQEAGVTEAATESIQMQPLQHKRHHLNPRDWLIRRAEAARSGHDREGQQDVESQTAQDKRRERLTETHTHSPTHRHSHMHKTTHARRGDELFANIRDTLEDLSPEARHRLIQWSYLHVAVKFPRPVVWIPRDPLGISDDEILHTRRFSGHIWISNSYASIDGKGNAVYRHCPPDFTELNVIKL